MSGDTLQLISEAMREMGLRYGFMEYVAQAGDALPATYFVGEYQEIEMGDESGEEDTIFILTGFSRENMIRLEQAKEKIKKCFPRNNGRVEKMASGTVAAVFYENSFPVPMENEELKKMQINLQVKEWKVEL